MILFVDALTYLNAFWSQLFTELAGNSSHIEMNYQTIFPGNQLSYHFTGLSSHRGWPSDSGIASFAPALSPRPSHILDHLNILASLDRRLARRCPIVLIDRPSPSGGNHGGTGAMLCSPSASRWDFGQSEIRRYPVCLPMSGIIKMTQTSNWNSWAKLCLYYILQSLKKSKKIRYIDFKHCM